MNNNPVLSFKRGSGLVSLLLIAVLVSFGASNGFAAPPPPKDLVFETISLPPGAQSLPTDFVVSAQASGNPKLDSAIADLAAAARVPDAEALNRAQSQSLRLSGSRVYVQIVTHAAGLENVVEAVIAAGGEVTGVGNDGALVQGWLPVGALETVSAQDDVYLIRRPAEVVLLEDLVAGNSTTEGLAVINGPAWHAAGYKGAGVKVGIIDGGFEGYTSLLGTDLPASVIVMNFVDGEDIGDVDDDGDADTENHGLACAEIIHDVAPGATLYLAKILTNVDLEEAVTWLKDTHGVDIISTSIGFYNVTPGDGTGELADLAEDARKAGILWVTAASNDREAHWGGLYSDPDSNDVHNFNGPQEVNYFGPGDGDAYAIDPGYQFAVYVRWSDWDDVDQDYNLRLLRWNGSGWDTIASSTDTQNGGPGQTPTEFAVGTTTGSAAPYGFIIERASGSQNVNFEVFVPKFARPDEILHARSLSNLADVPDAMTVAALDVSSPFPQESYSSEGPTNGPGGAATGGCTKPDISGFANVSTESYGPQGFNGTSAATPHVAGATAVVLSAYPSYTPAQLQSFLEGRAVDMGSAGMDTQFGYGRLDLGSAPSSGDDYVFVYLPMAARNWPMLEEQIYKAYSTGDAVVMQGYADLNFGDTVDMWVGYDDLLDPHGKIVRSVIQFDVSAIAAHTPIDSAKLWVRMCGSWDYPHKSRTVTTYRVTSAWSESSVTWNSKPSFAEAYGSTSVAHDDLDKWYSFDVTDLVSGWVDGSTANYGVMLRGPEHSGSDSSWKAFYTRESSSDPYLEVRYLGYSTSAGAGDESLSAGQPARAVIEALTGELSADSASSDVCGPYSLVGQRCLAYP